MPITLQEAKVGMTDKVVQATIDTFQRESFLLDRLTFDNAVSPGTGGSTMTYGYLQLQTPSVAAGRAINSEYQPGEAKKVKKTADVKIMGGAFEVDRVLEATAATSEITFQLQEKVKATRNKFHYDVINGDSSTHPTDFDGLDKLVTGTSTEYKPVANIDLSTAEAITTNAKSFVLELDKWLENFDGKPDMFLVNSRMRTVLCAVARELKYYSQTEDAFGRKVDNYDGIAIVDIGEYFDGSTNKKCVPITVDGLTTIYAVKLGLDAFHGISPTGNKVINSYLPNLTAPGAVKKGEVELLAGVALKNSKKAGAFRKIKVQ